jgi:hypothetical protein
MIENNFSPIYTKQQLKDQISLGRDLIYIFYNFHDEFEKEVDIAIRELLTKYSRNDLQEVIYSTVKELAMNGVKANIKHIVFKETDVNSKDNDSILSGISNLQEVLGNPKLLEEYGEKAKSYNYKVILRIKHSNQRVIILVSNTTPMKQEEEERIRKKFEKALNYDSIAEYYMDNLDDAQAEGAGLGITMIVLLLKSSDIDPHSFTIYKNKDNETVAKIEIPLSDDYTPSREIYTKMAH